MNLRYRTRLLAGAVLALAWLMPGHVSASSHREAPLIMNDPQADNTDLYAFRSPDNPNTVTIIANYIPFEKPEGGPNWYTFGENIRYEIHIDNNAATKGDDIIYRFTFTNSNEDPSTFFNTRLGKANLKTSYKLEKSMDGGATFSLIITNGTVPPPNIGPRSIGTAVGLNSSYATLMANAIMTASDAAQEKVFCGPVDDPFFVDLAGAFDLGNFRYGGNPNNLSKDGVARHNVHSIVIQVPISALQKSGKDVSMAANILDPDFVIGVWASASRPAVTTLSTNGGKPSVSGSWVQVSRLGMPLTNEVVIPVGMKDKWNAASPQNDAANFAAYFVNPELALYMDTTLYGSAVPSLCALRVQHKSYTVLGNVDFGNGKPGLYVLKGNAALAGTALDDAAFGTVLLPDNKSPRAVDIMPIFLTGVPNLAPYQLATGKPKGNPLAAGKPFINNFLASPTNIPGDMLRLNMAVPVTPRNSPDFSSLGIIKAAVLGLTDSRFNKDASLQNIPNMDGFPNGRRLEDDVTTIEMQAVSGVALAAVGLWYDDYNAGSSTPVTKRLGAVLSFTAGPTQNDTTFQSGFPYEAMPWRGFDYSLNK